MKRLSVSGVRCAVCAVRCAVNTFRVPSVVVALTVLFLSVTALHAGFEDLGVSARPTGMGSAFTGVADDVTAIFYNPAGLTQLKQNEVSTSYGRLFFKLKDGSNINHTFVGYANPLGRYGTFAVGYQGVTLTGLFGESQVMLSYGYPIKRQLSAGITLKSLRRSFGSDIFTQNAVNEAGQSLGAQDPVFSNGKSVSKFSADVGFMYSFFRKYTLGLSALNISQPNMSVEANGTDKVKREVKLGGSFRTSRLILATDFARRGSNFNVHAGAEGWILKETLALRGGMGFGARSQSQASFGFSYHFRGFQLDYSLVQSLGGIAGTLGSHRASLSFKFGPWPAHLSPEEAQRFGVTKEKIPTRDEIEKAGRMHQEVVAAYQAGQYSQALAKATSAYFLNPQDRVVEQTRKRLEGLAGRLIPDQIEETALVRLLRSSISHYMANDGRRAMNSARYAADRFPTDNHALGLLKLLREEYADEAAKISQGVGFVDQRLEEALEEIYAGRYLATIGLTNEILDLEPNNALALTRQGSAYYALGDKVQSDKLWKRALELDPTNTELQEFLGGAAPRIKGETAAKRYTVAKGDTLPSIAAKMYGDQTRWRQIYEANKDKMVNPYALFIGQVLVIP